MKEDLFTILPKEIMTDILSRPTIPMIMSCKLVCKSWRNLIKSREFAISHLAKSVPLIVLHHELSMSEQPCKVLEFIDDQVNPCCNKSFSFDFPHPITIISSVDGLLFFRRLDDAMRLYICNPITREYIKLPYPPNNPSIFGLGVSKITRQYKIFTIDEDKLAPPKCDVYAYTLGTGCWRSVFPSDDDKLQFNKLVKSEIGMSGVFLKGNLHWLASDDLNATTPHIYCLDLETELFSTFSILNIGYFYAYKYLTILGDRLCFLGSDSIDEGIVIWSMKAYGEEKSWTREFVIKKENCPWNIFPYNFDNVFPDNKLVCFSTKTNSIRTINVRGSFPDFSTVAYTPSFLPQLKSFVKENVCSF